MHALPWTLHDDLTADRLIDVASLIARGRNNALDRYDGSIGDNAWTVGCRAYQFGRFEVEHAVASGEFPWLTVLDSSAKFTFKVGDIPVRFFRGDGDDPSPRTMHQSYPELEQLSLAFEDEGDAHRMCFRFAVETGIAGEINRIIFAGYLGDAVKCHWEVPYRQVPRAIHSIEVERDEGVDMPAPAVRILGRAEKDDSAA